MTKRRELEGFRSRKINFHLLQLIDKYLPSQLTLCPALTITYLSSLNSLPGRFECYKLTVELTLLEYLRGCDRPVFQAYPLRRKAVYSG